MVKTLTDVATMCRVVLTGLLIPAYAMLLIGLKEKPLPDRESTGYPIFWAATIGYTLGDPRNFFLYVGILKVVSVIGIWALPLCNILACAFPVALFVPTATAAFMNYEVNAVTNSRWFKSRGIEGTKNPWILPLVAAVASLILILCTWLIFFINLKVSGLRGVKSAAKELGKDIDELKKVIGHAGKTWEELICPVTGHTYWWNEEEEISTYRDPTKEWRRDESGRLNSYAVPVGGGSGAKKSSSLADVLLSRRVKASKKNGTTKKNGTKKNGTTKKNGKRVRSKSPKKSK